MLSAIRPFALPPVAQRPVASVRKTTEPQDRCELSEAEKPPSRAMTWAGRATAAVVALAIGLGALGVAIEAANPIVPHPEQVTTQQMQDYTDQCLARVGAKPSTDQALIERVERIADTLDPAQQWRVVDSGRVNAAACGSDVLVMEASVVKMLTDAELRFVMAHEEGHNKLDHPEAVVSYLDQAWWRLHVPVLNIDPRAGFAAFSREQELAADCYAVRVTGDAAAGISALQKTSEAVGGHHGSGPAHHPAVPQRIENMQACTLQTPPA